MLSAGGDLNHLVLKDYPEQGDGPDSIRCCKGFDILQRRARYRDQEIQGDSIYIEFPEGYRLLLASLP